MRVLCCGDRDWGALVGNDEQLVYDRLRRLLDEHFHGEPIVLVHGDARGADRMCARVAGQFNGPVPVFVVEPHPAKWDSFGKAAGPIRNQDMLRSGLDLALAFHHDLDHSKGTADMVRRLRAAGVPTEVIG